MTDPQSNPLIRKLEQLFPLTPEEKEVLDRSCSRTVQVAADKDLVREGDKPSDCNLLLDGMVCRYKILEDGKRQIFSFHIPGDIFDAQSFLLETMDHSVATLTPCEIAPVPHTRMREITESYPRIARAIWKDTLVDAAIFRTWMASIGRRSAYQRIAHLMCEMVTKLHAVGLADDHHRISWPMTQNELGDALGLSLVHVNRTLQELRGENLIQLESGVLVVHDWGALQHAAMFEPLYLHLKPPRLSESNGGARLRA
jgi:CRP-like cAMP-binding protein